MRSFFTYPNKNTDTKIQCSYISLSPVPAAGLQDRVTLTLNVLKPRQDKCDPLEDQDYSLHVYGTQHFDLLVGDHNTSVHIIIECDLSS